MPDFKQTIPKPKMGDACNGCGNCCLAELCPIANDIVSGFPDVRIPGPCPFVSELGGGRFGCGLAMDPKAHVPEIVADYGEDRVRASVRFLLGFGDACDAQGDDDTPDIVALYRLKAAAAKSTRKPGELAYHAEVFGWAPKGQKPPK